ncbi:MAG: hypothetical protein IJA29_09270, partial [Lachnospiraceae bacterium]|nr:hypothetical protein [Lachnospiraceae bacterium]
MNKKMMIFWAYSPIATFVFGCIGFLLTMAQVEGEILTEQQQIISSIFIVLVLVSVILVYVSMVVFI